MSNDRYQSPLSERYASKEMQYIFSPDKKFRTWRRLWIALAETEKELGLPITDEQIEELKAHADDINYDIVCNHFLAGIFNKVSGFQNGTFDYKPAEFTTSGEKAKNDITYKSSKGVVTIHCEIKNAFAGSYDKLWIKGFTYTSNDGTICNVKL